MFAASTICSEGRLSVVNPLQSTPMWIWPGWWWWRRGVGFGIQVLDAGKEQMWKPDILFLPCSTSYSACRHTFALHHHILCSRNCQQRKCVVDKSIAHVTPRASLFLAPLYERCSSSNSGLWSIQSNHTYSFECSKLSIESIQSQ